MRLYHYTRWQWARKILREGLIRPTESNASLDREHARPDVVWLTEGPWGDVPAWASGTPDKGDVRLIVEVADAIRWSTWARRQHVPASVQKALADGMDAHNWWVVQRPVLAREIVALEISPTPVVDRSIIEKRLQVSEASGDQPNVR